MKVDREQQLAGDVRTALRSLKGKLRLSEADMGAMSLLVAQHPAMSQWVQRRSNEAAD